MIPGKTVLDEMLSTYLHHLSSAIAEATSERQVAACLTDLLILLGLPHQDVLDGTGRFLTPDRWYDS